MYAYNFVSEHLNFGVKYNIKIIIEVNFKRIVLEMPGITERYNVAALFVRLHSILAVSCQTLCIDLSE